MQLLTEIITLERIVFLESQKKADALSVLVGTLAGSTSSNLFEKYMDAVLDRENILSTGLGGEMALPHGRLASENSFRIALGISQEGITDYISLDDKPVRIMACIIGPEGRQHEYLRLLARVTRFLKLEHDRLLECKSPESIFEIVQANS